MIVGMHYSTATLVHVLMANTNSSYMCAVHVASALAILLWEIEVQNKEHRIKVNTLLHTHNVPCKILQDHYSTACKLNISSYS